MNILFFGGTGRLSKDAAKLAFEKGHQVTLFTRGSKERSVFADPHYEMIYGNIRDGQASAALLKGRHFDAVVDFLSYSPGQMESTINIVKHHCKQYIFISTATVYRKDNDDEIVSEKSTKIGNDRWEYSRNKALCEKRLEDMQHEGLEMRHTIVRPYVTYGNTRVPYPIVPTNSTKEWSLLERVIAHRPIPVFDEGKTVTTLTHTKDFAKGLVGLFGNPLAYGEAFHITNDNNNSWGDVLEAIEKKLHVEINRAFMSQSDIYKEIPEYETILTGDKGKSARFNNNKIKSVVPEFSCDIPLQDGISDMIDFYKIHPELRLVDWHWNGQIDRLCKKHGYTLGDKILFGDIGTRGRYLAGRNSFICNALRALHSS